jgi:hypothetical protein
VRSEWPGAPPAPRSCSFLNSPNLMTGNGISDEYHIMRHMINLETVNTYEGRAGCYASTKSRTSLARDRVKCKRLTWIAPCLTTHTFQARTTSTPSFLVGPLPDFRPSSDRSVRYQTQQEFFSLHQTFLSLLRPQTIINDA